MANENPLYPETNSFDERWGGLPVEAPRFNYTPQSSLIESEPRKLSPYKLTAVEGDPFERAAERLRAPYKNVNDPNVGKFEKDDRFPYRSNIPVMASPFVHMAEGIPGVIGRGLTSFKDIAEGNLQVNDPMTGMLTPEAVARGLDAASLAGGGSLVGGAEPNSVGVFGGRLAKTADLEKLATAKKMVKSGESENSIWNKTGWFKGIDDKWRFEIPDTNLKANFGRGLTEEGLVHPELFKAYPQLKKQLEYTGTKGKYGGSYNTFDQSIEARAENPSDLRSVSAHELQHAIQDIEQFSGGLNPELSKYIAKGDIGEEKWANLTEKQKSNIGFEYYRRLAGEVEARNVQKRLEVGNEKHPFETQDVPNERQNRVKTIKEALGLKSDTSEPGLALALARLKPEIKSDYLYHKTRSADDIESIKENGLNPAQLGNHERSYFWHGDKAEKLADSYGDKNSSVLRVKKKNFPDYNYAGNRQAVSTGEVIPPEALEVKGSDGKWTALRSDTQKPGMVLAAAQPFYSAVEHAVNNTKQAKMPADQWLGTLSNAKGVKPEEMDWIGLKEHLASKGKEPVTKQEIQDFVNANKTELKEVDKGFSSFYKNRLDILNKKLIANGKLEGSEVKEYNRLIEAEMLPRSGKSATKYSEYQLPGGENYREKLLTLPTNHVNYSKRLSDINERLAEFDDMPTRDRVANPQLNAEWQALKKEKDQIESSSSEWRENYTSTHWDEPNVLAHVRMNDQTIEGKKSLHLEEIQSDWHQAGREHGYKKGDYENRLVKLNERNQELTERMDEAWRTGNAEEKAKVNSMQYELDKEYDTLNAEKTRGVPQAPFKKTWHELVLKRMLREAAENGYDRLSWTPGEAQNRRYPGRDTEAEGGMEKFYGTSESNPTTKGMIGQLLEKIGKEHGVKVNTGEIERNMNKFTVNKSNVEGKWNILDENGKFKESIKADNASDAMKQYKSKIGATQPIHYIDIPQSLQDQALGKGFPLFSGGHMFTPVAGNPHENK